MLLTYAVVDESAISESDQIATCALSWRFLREQATATGAAAAAVAESTTPAASPPSASGSVTLPLLDASGAPHEKATVTIQIERVGA